MARFAGQNLPTMVSNHPMARQITVFCSSRALDQVGAPPALHTAVMQNILVIDDKAELRSIIAATLTYAGYDVRQAANGREGIVMVLAEKPDLILCDVRMPEMDGYRTLAAIREFRGTAAIPFILMSGSMVRNEFRNAMACGADDYLLKPFTSRKLIVAIKSRLARQTAVQTEFCRRIEAGSEYMVPAFLSEPVPAGGVLALASGAY